MNTLFSHKILYLFIAALLLVTLATQAKAAGHPMNPADCGAKITCGACGCLIQSVSPEPVEFFSEFRLTRILSTAMPETFSDPLFHPPK